MLPVIFHQMLKVTAACISEIFLLLYMYWTNVSFSKGTVDLAIGKYFPKVKEIFKSHASKVVIG